MFLIILIFSIILQYFCTSWKPKIFWSFYGGIEMLQKTGKQT